MFIYNWKVIIKTKLSELMNLALDEYIFKLSQNESTQKNIQIDKGYYQKLLCSIISFINKVLNVQQYKNNYLSDLPIIFKELILPILIITQHEIIISEDNSNCIEYKTYINN